MNDRQELLQSTMRSMRSSVVLAIRFGATEDELMEAIRRELDATEQKCVAEPMGETEQIVAAEMRLAGSPELRRHRVVSRRYAQ